MEPSAAVRRRGADDLLSGLPDEILHLILLRLPSIAEAARTSVLSHRWRCIWTYMPELVLFGSSAPPPAASIDADLVSIDAVLRSSSAPSLQTLKIDISNIGQCDVPAHRVASWLRFASERLAGKLHVDLPWPSDSHLPRLRLDHLGRLVREEEEELALPLCERATEMEMDLGMNFFLRPPPVGSFAALTCLTIRCAKMDGGELGRIVSSAQCPRLRKLRLCAIELVTAYDVTICSGSLECLNYSASKTVKLEVTAPMLVEIFVSEPKEAYIVAPKLEKVEWKGKCYDPGRHKFAVTPRHLRSLSITYSSWFSSLISSTGLTQRFDAVNELMVSLALPKGIEGYVNFLTDMDKLPVCETLIIFLLKNAHAPAPIMLNLLRRCSCMKKLKLYFDWRIPSETAPCTMSGCRCLLPESYVMDGCTFDALEEIELSFFTGSTEEEEFVKLLLSRCNMGTLKRVDLTVPFVPVTLEIMEVVEGIRTICCPNTKVLFTVPSREVPEPSF